MPRHRNNNARYSRVHQHSIQDDHMVTRTSWCSRLFTRIVLPVNLQAYMLFTAGIYTVQFLWFMLWDIFVDSEEFGWKVWFAIAVPMWIWDAESIRGIFAMLAQEMSLIIMAHNRILYEWHQKEGNRYTEAREAAEFAADQKRDVDQRKQVLLFFLQMVMLLAIIALQIVGTWILADPNAIDFWAFMIPLVVIFGMLWISYVVRIILYRENERHRGGERIVISDQRGQEYVV